MILMEDVFTRDNVLVVSRGEVGTQSMKLRLMNFMANSGIKDYVKVIVPQ